MKLSDRLAAWGDAQELLIAHDFAQQRFASDALRLEYTWAEWERRAEFAADQYRRRNGEAQAAERDARSWRVVLECVLADLNDYGELSMGTIATVRAALDEKEPT